jgi:hypothetical protein
LILAQLYCPENNFIKVTAYILIIQRGITMGFESFNYRSLIKDPAHLTMDDMAAIYKEIKRIYKHVPQELLFEGEDWYQDCMTLIEVARDKYKDFYGKQGSDWRIAFSESSPNMFGSQNEISSKKLECFKKTLAHPKINFAVFPTPAGLHPDYKRNNEVTYDAHTRCRALDELNVHTIPTFLFVLNDRHYQGDMVAAGYAEYSKIDGDSRPRRIREIPLKLWDNNGIIIDDAESEDHSGTGSGFPES